MNEILQKLGGLAGSLAIFIAILTLLRDFFDVRADRTANFLNRALTKVTSWRYTPLVFTLLTVIAFWTLFYRIKRLESEVFPGTELSATTVLDEIQSVSESTYTPDPILVAQDTHILNPSIEAQNTVTAVEAEATSSPKGPVTSTQTPRATYTPRPTSAVIASTVEPGEQSIIQVTTNLGSNIAIELNMIDGDSYLIDTILNLRHRSSGAQIVLNITDDVYALIPLRVFVEAMQTAEGSHIVTLTSGEQIEGHLNCTLIDHKDRKYDLSNAKTVKLISLSDSDYGSTAETTEDYLQVWEIRLPNASLSYLGQDFEFFMEYVGASGYIYGGSSTYQQSSRSFNLQVGEDLNLVNLTDFDEVNFEADAKISVTTQTGITEGIFVPSITQARRWLLLVDVFDSPITIILENPIATIRRSPN
jgi:hypothetical protein